MDGLDLSAPIRAMRSEIVERHAALLDALSDAVFVVSARGTILYANVEASALLGYARGELDGQPVERLVPDPMRPAHRQRIQAYFRNPVRRPMGGAARLFACKADGTQLRVEISLSPFRVASTTVCLALLRDVTQETGFLELLRLRSAALEAAANGICITSPDGVILWVNPAFSQLTGFPEEEAVGSTPRILKSGRQSPDAYRALWDTICSGRVWHGELINRRRDGSEYIEEQTVTPVRDGNGAISHFIAVKTDVTARRRADDEVRRSAETLQQRTKELARSNEDLAQFAYAASHDLQEPLRMVSGFLQLLNKRYRSELNDEAREFIDFALDGAGRMKQLIDGLLDLSRVRTRGKELTEVDLSDVLDTALKLLGGAIRESNAQITYDALPRLRGDPAQLVQLFQNLLGNALKFRGDLPPRITVAAEPISGGWHVCVSDNGIGIDAAHQERIFEIFQRLHDRQRYAGAGMGLALCKRIVERHHGRIWVESEPGQGASFHFTLRAPLEQGGHAASP